MRALPTAALVAAAGIGGCQFLGCAVEQSGSGCTATPFISPTTVTLDHTVKGNSQQFVTGTHQSGTDCVTNALAIQYQWGVSDTVDASITSPGGVASCTNAALNPITVSSYLQTYSGSPLVASLTPSGLPSATLICK